jgi:TRAP-type C4-dicarboxylate transport system permease small subunit
MTARLLATLQKWERRVALSAFGLMTLLVLADIALRELAHQSFAMGPKLAIDLMIWGGFLGAALTSGKGTHLKAEAATKVWPVNLRPWIEALSEIVTGVFCAGLAWVSCQYVLQSRAMGEVGVVTGIPLWISQAVLPWTFASMAIRHLAHGWLSGLRPMASIEDLK